MDAIAKLTPSQAYQLRGKAVPIAATIGSVDEDKALLKYLQSAYLDYPNPSYGSRQQLLDALSRAMSVGDIDVVASTQKAIANTVVLTGEWFDKVVGNDQKKLQSALNSFLWWSETFKKSESIINKSAAKRAA
jgi:hypothetical protein